MLQRGNSTSGYNQWQFTLSTDGIRLNNVQTALSPLWVYGTSGNPRVGINQQNAGSALSVNGGVAIGSTYSTLVAPSDGLLVQGNVGIGTTSPQYSISVTANSSLGYYYSLHITLHHTLQRIRRYGFRSLLERRSRLHIQK
jgi:hypothetical protein